MADLEKLSAGVRESLPELSLIGDADLRERGVRAWAVERSQRNLPRWRANPARPGLPAIRHPVYGVHIALTAGLPEAIVHIVGGHSMYGEGSLINPSVEDLCVQHPAHAH